MAQPNFAERLGELKRRGLVALVAEGASETEIAKRLGVHRSTLQPYVKAVKQELDEHRLGPLEEPKGPPLPQRANGLPEVHLHPPREQRAMPRPGVIGLPDVHQGPPPLYIHPGIPDSSMEESVRGAEALEDLQQGIPSLPHVGSHKDNQGPPLVPQGSVLPVLLLEDLQQAWPELQNLLSWWRARHQQAHEPAEKLERVTYHVQPKWIEAVKREADRTGDSYAAVVNRAFRQYFEGT